MAKFPANYPRIPQTPPACRGTDAAQFAGISKFTGTPVGPNVSPLPTKMPLNHENRGLDGGLRIN